MVVVGSCSVSASPWWNVLWTKVCSLLPHHDCPRNKHNFSASHFGQEKDHGSKFWSPLLGQIQISDWEKLKVLGSAWDKEEVFRKSDCQVTLYFHITWLLDKTTDILAGRPHSDSDNGPNGRETTKQSFQTTDTIWAFCKLCVHAHLHVLDSKEKRNVGLQKGLRISDSGDKVSTESYRWRNLNPLQNIQQVLSRKNVRADFGTLSGNKRLTVLWNNWRHHITEFLKSFWICVQWVVFVWLLSKLMTLRKVFLLQCTWGFLHKDVNEYIGRNSSLKQTGAEPSLLHSIQTLKIDCFVANSAPQGCPHSVSLNPPQKSVRDFSQHVVSKRRNESCFVHILTSMCMYKHVCTTNNLRFVDVNVLFVPCRQELANHSETLRRSVMKGPRRPRFSSWGVDSWRLQETDWVICFQVDFQLLLDSKEWEW